MIRLEIAGLVVVIVAAAVAFFARRHLKAENRVLHQQLDRLAAVLRPLRGDE